MSTSGRGSARARWSTRTSSSGRAARSDRGSISQDADQLVPIGILRTLTHRVVVGSVDCPELVGKIPQAGHLGGNRINLALRNDIARQRLSAELPTCRRSGRVRIVDLILGADRQETREIALSLRKCRYRFDHPW